MDGRKHWQLFLLLVLPMMILYIVMHYEAYIFLLFIGSLVVDPDKDKVWFGGRFHRSILSHTLLYPLGIAFCFYLPFKGTGISFLGYFVALSFAAMVHLFGDIFSRKRTGFYCTSYFFGRFNANISTAIYLGNALVLLAFNIWFFYGRIT